MNDIGGNVCIRNGEDTDFPWREAVSSLLPICDTVTICDGGSTDGTLEAIKEWQSRDPKIRLVHFPWDNPVGETHLWVRWLNWCREQIPNFWHLQLDADEVLFESSYEWIDQFTREKGEAAAWGERLNFWKDPWHISPEGIMCGHRVARLASTSLWMPTDYAHPQGERLCSIAVSNTPIRIAHYGYVRNREGIQNKVRRYLEWTIGTVDPRTLKAEQAENWYDSVAEQCGWRNQIKPYNGPHPKAALCWLERHGFNVNQTHHDRNITIPAPHPSVLPRQRHRHRLTRRSRAAARRANRTR